MPYITSNLPGTGGNIGEQPEDFRVDEVPAYSPQEKGEHIFLHIEKRETTTLDVVASIAKSLGIAVKDVGYAGMKDRNAITRQWISIPPPIQPEQVAGLQIPKLEILSVERHPHKLRTGHLRGNRFCLVIRNTIVDGEQAAQRANALFAQLALPPGNPNWFGAQRFGRDRRNVELGRALIDSGSKLKVSDRRKKRLFVSAFQSALFNEVLRRRIVENTYRTVLDGDILKKTESGGIFDCTQPQVDQQRLQQAEVIPTGPMYGYRMRQPIANTTARQLEDALLTDCGLCLEDFRSVGKLAIGTRRPLSVSLGETAVSVVGANDIEVKFQLPPGAYATIVAREITRT